MSERKPWQPRIREEPLLNPFEPPTDRTRNLGANDRIEVPDEEGQGREPKVKMPDCAFRVWIDHVRVPVRRRYRPFREA